jgi:hypothetical protein
MKLDERKPITLINNIGQRYAGVKWIIYVWTNTLIPVDLWSEGFNRQDFLNFADGLIILS